jgi:acyl carrier protein
METVTERVKRFIQEDLSSGHDSSSLTDDFPLIEQKVLDSLGIVQIVTMLEDEYDIVVEDEELVPENFGSLSAIDRLVRSKSAS